MPISITCECGKRLSVKDELAGKRVRCPGCQATITVAAKQPAAAPAKPKATVGAQKNGPAVQRPLDEDEEQQDQEAKPARPSVPMDDDEEMERPKKKPMFEDEESDEDLRPKKKPSARDEDQEESQDDDVPRKKKAKQEDDELDDLLEDVRPKKKVQIDDDEEEEPVAKKKPARKAAEEEDEDEEEKPKGKKDAKGAKKAAKDEDEEDEDEAPKKGKGKDKGKGKGKPEVPPPMLQYNNFIVKARAKAGKPVIDILDGDSSDEVASGKNVAGFLSRLLGTTKYEIKDGTTDEPAFYLVGKKVLSGKRRNLGSLKLKSKDLNGGLSVLNEKGKPWCEANGKLKKTEYKFVNEDEEEIATVSKDWGEAFESVLSGPGTFGVQFGEEFQGDNNIKTMVLAASIAVEILFQKAKAEKGAEKAGKGKAASKKSSADEDDEE